MSGNWQGGCSPSSQGQGRLRVDSGVLTPQPIDKLTSSNISTGDRLPEQAAVHPPPRTRPPSPKTGLSEGAAWAAEVVPSSERGPYEMQAQEG